MFENNRSKWQVVNGNMTGEMLLLARLYPVHMLMYTTKQTNEYYVASVNDFLLTVQSPPNITFVEN